MRNRVTGAVLATALAAGIGLAVMPTTAQQPAAGAQAGQAQRPARIAGRPNLNGIWQALNTANWNLEDHSAAPDPSPTAEFWQLGALFAVPAGQSVIVDNKGVIPYTPAGLKKRAENLAGWPKSDPEAKCYMPGLPRATYMPYPFQIVQGQKDILFVYEYASSNRIVHMVEHSEPPVDSWMGWSNGEWDGDTLVIEATGFNDQSWFDRAGNHHSSQLKVTERYTLMGDNHLQYEARIEDPATFTQPWTIRMPLYRRIEPNVQLLEFKCVEFVTELMYGHLRKEPIK